MYVPWNIHFHLKQKKRKKVACVNMKKSEATKLATHHHTFAQSLKNYYYYAIRQKKV